MSLSSPSARARRKADPEGGKKADGIVMVKTTQAVLVCEYGHPTTPGDATKIVEGQLALSFDAEPS